MTVRRVFACLVIVTLIDDFATNGVCADSSVPKPAYALAVPLMDLQGSVHQLERTDRGSIRVIVFLSTECPVSNGYLQTLNRLREQTRAEQVQIFGVLTDLSVTRVEAAAHFEEFDLAVPVLFDTHGILAKLLRPTHVPEAFVLDDSNAVVYRGAIDDTWRAVGRRRPQPAKNYLADAIDALARRKPILVSKTTPVGCLFETFAIDRLGAAVTYYRDIAPIINSRCLNCHRKGQVAPFGLGSYEQVAKRADWIASVTHDRIMPPWIPHPGEERFVGERWLSDHELSLLREWAETGRAEGNVRDA
ncbi:MAG: redoxin domain-containing protein, partial [Planctomycetota bacterium]